MTDPRKAATRHYSFLHKCWNVSFKEICCPLEHGSLLHHSDGQQASRIIFARQSQRNLCESYVILRIYPMTEIENPSLLMHP